MFHQINPTTKRLLVYSCIFGNCNYINLLSLLLKSYITYGVPSNNIDYLVICSLSMKSKVEDVFNNLNINGLTWCLDIKTPITQYTARLKIFEYPDINTYSKILYLDCDILVTGKIDNMLKFELENKLYALQEGNTNHVFWGKDFFENNPNIDAFSSGIMLFNNHIEIETLFALTNQHIQKHVENKLPIPGTVDQPFIVYQAVVNKLYDNTRLIGLVVNNPVSYNNEIISHFPGGLGHYTSKIVKMQNYITNVMCNVTSEK
jgi:alpha-N-acetylglucosamine transferase